MQIFPFSRRHKYTEVMTSDAALLKWITGQTKRNYVSNAGMVERFREHVFLIFHHLRDRRLAEYLKNTFSEYFSQFHC